MAWRLAYSLDTLLAQVNEAYPNRGKASDGTIGDAAHQAVPSDHNPNPQGVVCALDITNDPPTLDAHALADRLLAARHPDLKYLISNKRIAGDWTDWQWTPYSGTSDPHINHIHISVGVGPDGQSVQPYDDRVQWNVKENNMPYIEQAVLDDYEAWKVTGQQLSYDPAYPAMGGKPGSPLVVVNNGKVVSGDTTGIGIVMDDFRKNKEENLAKPATGTVLKPGDYIVK